MFFYLQIKFETRCLLERYRQELQSLIRPRRSELHSSAGEWLIASKGRALERDPYECTACGRLLYGLVTVGIRCPACKGCFHKRCFMKGRGFLVRL